MIDAIEGLDPVCMCAHVCLLQVFCFVQISENLGSNEQNAFAEKD